MSQYIDVGGIHTWYDERGQGEPLVLLHPGGAGVDARAWGPNLPALAERFRVFTPERRAHGRTPDVDGPITFELMADDTIAFLDAVVGEPAHLMGCSDGATVALLVALQRPDLVRKLVFVAGVSHHDGWAPGVVDPDNVPPEFLARLYGEISPDGPEHYPVVVAKLATMHLEGPTLTGGDLDRIASRTLVMIGDDDEVRLEHAIELYRSLLDAELAIIPGTSHGLLVEKPGLCHTVIIDFLTTDPVPTMAPIRRADDTSRYRVGTVPRRRIVIDHVSIGVSDLARSREFYRHALTPLGFAEIGPWRDGADEVTFGLEEADDFGISTAYPPSGSVHVAFAADRREQVDAFYEAAIDAGGRDNGPPGLRPEYSDGYYGAFVLDPDGHNIEAVHHDRV